MSHIERWKWCSHCLFAFHFFHLFLKFKEPPECSLLDKLCKLKNMIKFKSIKNTQSSDQISLPSVSVWPVALVQTVPVALARWNVSFRTLRPFSWNINLHQSAPRRPGIQSNRKLCQPPQCLLPLRPWHKRNYHPAYSSLLLAGGTTNLIEYVIARGSEVGLGSLRCRSTAQSLNLFMGR